MVRDSRIAVRLTRPFLLPIAAAIALSVLPAATLFAQPLLDAHQHLFSPALAALMSSTPPQAPVQPVTARDLIGWLDAAGITRALVLSTAYIFSQPTRHVENDYDKVRAENDWTSQQVGQFPDRLVGFCSINPVKDYALAELERCARDPNLRRGLKLHFGNSQVDYHNADHVARVARVFRAANDRRMAIVVHMRSSVTLKAPYGRDEARVFLDQLLPAAPDVAVQVAHLAGSGGYEPAIDQALSVFVDAIATGDPRAKRLWFDVTSVAQPQDSAERSALLASRIRELGVQRVLYGSDAGQASTIEGWKTFRKVPLSDEEFQVIAKNVPAYLQ